MNHERNCLNNNTNPRGVQLLMFTFLYKQKKLNKQNLIH